MINLFHSIILGIVQGLGEFLPISSSAHLVILPWLADFPTPGLTFDIALHFGTLIALLAYFFRDWINLARAFFSSLTKSPKRYSNNEKLIWYIILGSIPAAIVGLTVESYAETIFRNPLWVAINMAGFGLLLFAADHWGKKNKSISQLTLADAIWIGIAQSLALIPGTSRSGVTISAGMALGLDRTAAARFSFLLSMPAVAGAALLKSKDFLNMGMDLNVWIGVAVSAVVGYLAIKYMLYFLKTYSYTVYVIYRLLFAAVVFTALWIYK